MKRLTLLAMGVCTAGTLLAQVAPKKTSSLLIDADLNGKTNPGDTLRYTITITNTTGTNLLNVQFTDPIFPNQTLVAGSIKTTPIALPDSYSNVIGNTLYNVPAATGVLANDSDPDGDPISVVSYSALSAHGGSVTVTNNGGFSFLPPVGYQGSDTFTYTVSDGKGGFNTTSVTLAISNMVWYVSNAGANGDGRQISPFNSLAPLNGAGGSGDVDGINDYIYLFQGSAAYTNGIYLEAGQTLIGAGAPLVVGGTTIYAAGTRPLIATANAGAHGITLTSGNTVQGLNVYSTSARAITGTGVGALLITNVTASTSGGDAAVYLDTGSVNVALDSVSATNSVGTGVTLNNLTGGFVANAGWITNCTGTDLVVSGGNANITFPGTIGDSSGRLIDINSRTGGVVTISGPLNSGGTGIVVQNNSGGMTVFSGDRKLLNTGLNGAVTLTSNTGHTINFTNGNLTIAGSPGFTATGGAAAVNVTGVSNTVNAASGTALNIANTTIGSSGLIFQSISSGASTGSGIILDTTGNFGLTVTGTGTAASGGTLAIKTGTDLVPTTGIGIYLNSTRNHSFSWLQINDCQNYGIRGVNVTEILMTNIVVNGVNGTSTANREGSVVFDNAFGTCALVNSTVRGSIEDNLRVENDNGTLTSFLVSNCTIGNNSILSGNNGVRIASKSTAVMNATVRNCTLQGNRTDAINCDAGDSSTLTIGILTNTIIAGTSGNNQGNIGIDVTVGLNGQVNFNIDANKVGTDGVTAQPLLNTGINVFNGTLAGGTPALMTGTVRGNTVVNAGTGFAGLGVRVFNQGYGTIAANVSGNNISNVGTDYGLLVEASSNSGTAAAACITTVGVTGNIVNVLSGALDAIRVQARGRGVVNARINSNSSAGGGAGFRGLEIRQGNQTIGGPTYTATFNLEGLSPGLQTVYATIVNFLASQNPGIAPANCDALYVTGITGVAFVPGIP